MRLIDADAFEKFIKAKYKDGESTDDIKDQVLFDLSYQPTAYDVEKVAKRLENMRDNASRNIKLNSQSYDIKYEVECNEKHYNKIIEIIRNGEQK